MVGSLSEFTYPQSQHRLVDKTELPDSTKKEASQLTQNAQNTFHRHAITHCMNVSGSLRNISTSSSVMIGPFITAGHVLRESVAAASSSIEYGSTDDTQVLNRLTMH
jgi:hypothetical protein